MRSKEREVSNAKEQNTERNTNKMLTMTTLLLLLLCATAFPVHRSAEAQFGLKQCTVLASMPNNEVDYDCIVIGSGNVF